MVERELRKVIITGVTGFIGSALAKKLLLNDVKVYGVGRSKEALEDLKQYGDFISVEADFDEYDKLHELIDDCGFDMLWHFAWNSTASSASNFHDYFSQIQNINATCNVALAAVKLNCSTVSFCGSFYQQCSISQGKYQFNPITYGVAKKSASELFMGIAYNNKIPCINIIIPNVSGCSNKANMGVLFFINQMLNGKPLNLITGDQYDDWIYIDDLIEGILCSIQTNEMYTEYYIGHRELTTFKDRLLMIKAILSSESELLFGTYPENYHVDFNYFDLEALYRDTGWEAKINFPESINRIKDWISK